MIKLKLIETAPFVRYALRFKFSPKTEETVSVDCRLFYISSGRGNIVLNGTSHHFADGSVIIFQPGTKYKFIAKEKLDIISINFDYTAEYANQTLFFRPTKVKKNTANFHKLVSFEDCAVLNAPLVVDNAYTVAAKLLEIVEQNISKSAFFRERCSVLLKECLINVLDICGNGNTGNKKLNMVEQYIKENYNEEITNERLAQLVNYHPYYLNRIFQKNYGKTLHQYLIDYRISVAEQLLTTTPESVANISQRVGFSSLGAFTLNFKKKNGITPAAFRTVFKNAI